jgi:phospholipid/cholesterol/gamma-HCH transport system permease protein
VRSPSIRRQIIRIREPEFHKEPTDFIERLGRNALLGCEAVGQATLLLVDAIVSLRYIFTKRSRKEILIQMFVSGIKSLGVITIVAVFTGMILALQTGLQLRKFNQEVFIGTAVMVSMLREMGPFMTGLILAACVGSAMAAQLGTMAVSEEIDALEIMSIDPVRFLVMPRLVSMAIMTPFLSFYTSMMGVLGGGVVGVTQLDVPWAAYLDNATTWADVKDLRVGLFKAFLFGVIITIVSCHEGLSTTQGAVGVGMATRRSVIISFLLILIVGYYITRLFY